MEYNFKDIHIGELIHQIVKLKDTDKKRILNFFNDNALDLNEVYCSKNISSDNLLKWSKLLKYDFFRIYSQHIMLYANMEPLIPKGDKSKIEIPVFKKSIYTKEIIDFICELIKNKHKTKDQIITEYNIPKTTLYRWLKKYNL